MIDEVLIYLHSLLKENDAIVVATSGGPDSMLLLHLLCLVKKEINIKIIVAHVNHKLREESDEEAEFVKNFALQNELVFEYNEIKEYDHDNLENAARQKRYEFFGKLINKYRAKYLMTAHHGDDLIETILMRLVRGSSLKGYSGFKKKSGNIVRPLITLTKKDILEYMENHELKYYIDKSNFSNKYTRNRYRMEILPFLKKENKNVHLKFLKFSEELDAVNSFLNDYIALLLKRIKDEKGIKISELLKTNEFLVKKVIEYELSLIYTNDLFLIDDRHTFEVMNLIKSRKSNMSINLPNNYVAIKDYNYFRIVHNKKSEDFRYVLNDIVKLPNGIIKKCKSNDSNSNYVIRLNSNKINLPIIVRNRRNGDKMLVKNLRGSKKVKDIFIDEKVSISKRSDFPVVTDSKDVILWLPGVKKSKFDVERNGIYDIILSYEEEF